MKNDCCFDREENKYAASRGFTLVEVLFSFVLVLIALIYICNIIVFSYNSAQKSRVRLQLNQEIEYRQNLLLTKPFAAPELQEGRKVITENGFLISTNIQSINSYIKQIRLGVTYKKLTRHVYFYKSMYIKEVTND